MPGLLQMCPSGGMALKQVRPLLTSERVLTEAAYFLGEDRGGVDPLFKVIELKTILVSDLIAKSQVLTVDRLDVSVDRRNHRLLEK